MPILEGDPWRDQFFEDVKCPERIKVPLKDYQAWQLFPKHRKVYDKLFVALSQGLSAAPHGVLPDEFPVFSKPITNLQSMGKGSLLIPDLVTYRRNCQPGHFWSTLLTGNHISSDVAIVEGEVRWWGHSTAFPGPNGTFDHFRVETVRMNKIEKWIESWASVHLAAYIGMANFETIGGRIIEVHLRFTDQWPDLYGKGWMDAVVNLYENHVWKFDDTVREVGYSVVLFGEHGCGYLHPTHSLLEEVSKISDILSIQISFHEDRDHLQSNPPGGVRLAVVNSKSLEAGRVARNLLSKAIQRKTS